MSSIVSQLVSLLRKSWDCLKTAHEGTEQVKESKIDMLTSLYENFKIKEGETIYEMFTKLSLYYQ